MLSLIVCIYIHKSKSISAVTTFYLLVKIFFIFAHPTVHYDRIFCDQDHSAIRSFFHIHISCSQNVTIYATVHNEKFMVEVKHRICGRMQHRKEGSGVSEQEVRAPPYDPPARPSSRG